MTATALRIKSTPMAPYINLMQGMTREQKMIVVMYLTESMNEHEPSQSNNGSRISPSMKWNSMNLSESQKWNCQDAWNQLTDKQREEAQNLNLSAEDMDEKTFAIIQKHMK
ncbi:MAG: hypothetical protein J6Z01_11020 [Bacteroidales bacterium]|nr:hypothetical protein [Bacteroidales bacterium]